ncbi:phosphatase PAP2 family protein [Anaeromicrobium sediminis]|uniref:Phosphatidic acid phosphatase type 2/haloperoxidase domain-containing protein n=1 Tax=Anaeromicrobium sediminis TaxID=1478221 RepID=A0A267MNF1_9FIRM|nr:phosphatase PAP2 family protein [Anaeromicrobium sediminis]PAB61109.1 hypothetical protein CCE28_01385 [Anaeromicrobium sediminis]
MLQLLNELDKNIVIYIHNNIQIHSLNSPMAFITKISDYGFIWMILICILMASKKYRKIGYIVAFSFLLSRIEVHAIKELVKRPRPFIEITYLNIYISKPTSSSFPSGHAISSFATIGVLVNMISNKCYKLILIFTAFLISISRLYLMVHYPSDLIVGILLGLLSSRITLRVFKI